MSFPSDSSPYSTLQERMVNAQLRSRGITDQRVLDAMARVPRHEFAPERYRDQAYEDHPLPIAEGQTISQPYIVAIMLQALALKASDRVLEIGTGSGYVTALLAELTGEVISIERHATLANAARELLSRLGYSKATVVVGDGTRGFAECAPYDAILVSAAASELPLELVEQLAEGGRLMIPVGCDDSQQLHLIEKRSGKPKTTLREMCRFVPLVPKK
jgi:protein-L-isoaspartate(D-aspartate) O-methyltransferase